MSEKDPSGGRRTPRRSFDATWLPFGFMIGTAVGIGTGMVIFGSLLAGVVVGVLLGLAIGVAMGLSRGRGHRSPEEVEDALIEAAEREAEARRRRD
ncbi:hypothetical protein [Brachybacterium squillarum]|uniref:hypothetical protein n=1 Tax=Brachybacterium squillarum TaxID=661979 RepID=UPI000262B1F5|nr:hypothetical protein [Brachybacterium squillarum]